MATIHCYRSDAGYIIAPLAFNELGWGLVLPYLQNRDVAISDAELGAAIKESIPKCDYALYDPSIKDPVYLASREKSKVQFMRKWHLAHVKFDGVIEVAPSTRYKKAFWYLMDSKLCLSLDSTDSELGAVVKQALALCRDGPRDFSPNGKPIC